MRSESPMDGLDSLSIRDLRAVVTVAERLHFGKAAEDLSIAQPWRCPRIDNASELARFLKETHQEEGCP